MTRRVVGIDPSLTGTGIAIITEDGAAQVDTIATKTTGRSVLDRDQRLTDITSRITQFLDDRCDQLVVIEGPSLGNTSPHTWDRAGLWWRIVRRIHAHDLPLAVCPPTVRAKWATGKGNAGKAAVVAAVARMWPDVDLLDDNAADALAFASIAAQRLGFPSVPVLARHRDVLGSVDWPTYLADDSTVEVAA